MHPEDGFLILSCDSAAEKLPVRAESAVSSLASHCSVQESEAAAAQTADAEQHR
ncbi:hypothetical protein RUMCAL_01224 [Ruminococcus callidus ATCC 27760]|uniref:Uncharacterized protein n=1 Tax=Ruminococcus callidus ATCC 27760 TaxID=411473 RepID=U2KVV2_9FIRM|nr:hypothetical protein RUMCAL_01224 [Ruminococcus callidus ATCC 27760]